VRALRLRSAFMDKGGQRLATAATFPVFHSTAKPLILRKRFSAQFFCNVLTKSPCADTTVPGMWAPTKHEFANG
jgi:hypothetical protein